MKINQDSVCKIYSRKRFGKFSFNNVNRNNKNYKREKKITIRIIAIIFFSMILFIIYRSLMNSIAPIFETLCRDKAREIATNITNDEATNVMKKYEYDELFNIERDSVGDIQLISSNIITINKITSDIAIEIQKSLYEKSENSIIISTGSVTGLKMLSGMGPDIELEMSSVGNVKTDLRSVFEEKSINQTLHKIYLEVRCEVSILTPFNTIKEDIVNQVLLSENVIVGKIPESYYNLHGFEEGSDLLEVAP